MEFVPPNKRSEEYFKSVFEEKGLNEIVKLHLAQVSTSTFVTVRCFSTLLNFEVMLCDHGG